MAAEGESADGEAPRFPRRLGTPRGDFGGVPLSNTFFRLWDSASREARRAPPTAVGESPAPERVPRTRSGAGGTVPPSAARLGAPIEPRPAAAGETPSVPRRGDLSAPSRSPACRMHPRTERFLESTVRACAMTVRRAGRPRDPTEPALGDPVGAPPPRDDSSHPPARAPFPRRDVSFPARARKRKTRGEIARLTARRVDGTFSFRSPPRSDRGLIRRLHRRRVEESG